MVDKKLVQKEQLVMPTAAPDLNMINGSVSFQVASNINNPVNFELVKGPTPIFDDQRQI